MTEQRTRVQPVRDHVALLEMDGGANNPLDVDLVRGLADHLDELSSDAAVRAVVLCSRGKHFCAGAVAKLAAGTDWATEDLYAQIPRIAAFSKPLVVALNGAAIGGGAGLAMLADWRQMANDGRFQANFSLLGYTPGFGLSRTLPEAVGPHRARELLMSGRPVFSAEALSLGVADGISEPGMLVQDAIARAVNFAAAAPLAVSAIKRLMRDPLLRDLSNVLKTELEEQRRLKLTADYSEGITAMRERRTPEFRGL